MSDDPAPIRIGVDARPLSSPLSGVSRVISRILKYFPEPERFQFLLYSNRSWHSDFDEIINLPNVIWVQGRGVTARKAGLWFNLTLPAILRKSEVHLFWGSQQVIPPFLPSHMPVVMTYYDLVLYFFPDAMRPLARLQQRMVQRLSVRRSARILSISAQTRDDMVRLFRYPPERAGVALLGYEPPPQEKRKIRTRREILGFNGPYILAVSTIEPRKNYTTLLEAFALYGERERKEGREPYPLVIAGRRGWESPAFYERLEELQRDPGNIHVVEGASDGELDQLYRGAAFFCMSSLYEGFGLPLLEALAAERYALVSDLGCFHEIGGERIRYLPVLDQEAWAGALLETVELHRKKRLGRVEFPLEEWGWDRTASLHREAFRQVLEEFAESERSRRK